MPKLQAIQIQITPREEKILNGYVNKKKAEIRLKERAEIVLLAGHRRENHKIGRLLKKSLKTVKLWRKRWKQNWEDLQVFAEGQEGKGVSDHELEEKILEILGDAPRPGTPLKISKAQQEQIRAMACQKPEEYGYPFAKWSERTLAQAVVKQGIVKSISGVHTGRILKKTKFVRIKPNTGSIPK